MTDRELLELAAKAAGELHLIPYKEEWITDPLSEAWNPRINDDEALRLAVKLNLSMDLFDSEILVGYTANCNDCAQVVEPVGNDPYAATRRAIVRAAAEIGKDWPCVIECVFYER